MRLPSPFLTALLAACCAAPCAAQLRVVQWNVTNYESGRVADFQTALYASFGGRSVAPDVLIAEEIVDLTGALNFLDLLNRAPGSPGDWTIAPFVANSGDSSNALYFRAAKADFLGVVTLDQGTGSGPGMPPRDNQRWRIRLGGYSSAGAELYVYAAHMKAGSNATDRDRRLPEAQRIRNDAQALPPGSRFLLAGDFNMQSWNEEAYQVLIGPAPSALGRFFDPIKSPGFLAPSPPGSWNNNPSFRFVHTQDPGTCDASCGAANCNGGGMDDRHDQILISAPLAGADGLSYVGDVGIPSSTSTWNDPNHSYRAWGNDGTSFNCRLTIAGNTMVGPSIAAALVASADGQGHLPVFLDLRAPARIAAPTAIDFGTVGLGADASRAVTIGNGADVALWSRPGNGEGIDDLDYSLAVAGSFFAPPGVFSAPAGLPGNTHTIAMDTSAPGTITGALVVASDDPDHPTWVILLTGVVSPPPPACACDWDRSGDLNSQDFFAFLASFFASDGDFNDDGTTSSQDLFEFLACYFAGC